MCLPFAKCCFCVNLDVGSKIISLINLISSVLISMVYGTAAMLPSPVAESRKVVYAIMATVAMFQLVIGCIMMYGVFGKKPWLMLPWLVTTWVFCVTLISLSILGPIFINLHYAVGKEATAEVTAMASVYFVYGLVLYFFSSIINSRRDELLHDVSTDSEQRLMKWDTK